jgi:DNA replication protein DnaC
MTTSSRDHGPKPLRLSSGETRQAVCDKHGAYESRHLFHSHWSGCPGCAADRDREESEARLAEQRLRQEREQRQRLDAAAIPARFVGKGFDNFVAETPEQRRALSVCRDFAEQFDTLSRRGAGLILMGPPGTGKSHLSAAILQALADSRRVQYTSAVDLIRAVRATWRRDSEQSERSLFSFLGSLDLLVIDEVGAQYGTDGEAKIIFDVIDHRYRDLRSTILITNRDRGGLREDIGDRAYDRLTETSRQVVFDWPSYRKRARLESES